MSNENLGRLTCSSKSGSEAFRAGGTDLSFKLIDFWQWSSSDLVSNTMRGVLAEFLVAKALGLDCGRLEWEKCDLVTAEGLKIQVKSSAYLQSWAQTAPSKIQFVVSKRRAWDPDTNKLDGEPARHADVYVFALLAHQDKSSLDPLDLDQW